MPTHFEESRQDLEPYGFTCEVWEPQPMNRADRHNELELNLLEAGSLSYLLGGRRVTLGPRRLAAFWAATPHQVLSSRGLTFYYVVTIPLAWVLGWGLPEALVGDLLAGSVVEEPDAAAGDRDLERFAQWHDDLSPSRDRHEEPALLEIKARLLRLATAIRAQGTRGRGRRALATVGGDAPNSVERMAAFVARHYREAIGIEEVAREVDFHPDYAAALFRKAFGITPSRFILQHRVSHAQRMLITSDAKILEIAMDSGFGSLSRFNAAFRELCGCSPRSYRSLHRP